MQKKYLMSPGPTQVPLRASLAFTDPIIHHRTQEYKEIFRQVNENLKYLFCTSNDVLTFTSSGTGAMEAAVVNLLSKGDKALVVRGGKFGERWSEICEVYGVEVTNIDVEWGCAVEPGLIEEALKKDPSIKAVFTTLCETSTGVVNDIKRIGEIVAPFPTILVVDAISGLGAQEMPTDQWKVDVCVSGSQKGLMIPPGLAFASVSEKAWKLAESSDLPKYYLSMIKARKGLSKDQTAFTPAVSLVCALNETLKMMREEGLGNILARHERLAKACRAGVTALGLELFAKSPANNCTAIKVPEGLDGKVIKSKFSKDYGITIAGGQGHIEGKIFRISHLGYADTFDVVMAISCLEMVLSDSGRDVEFGKGVAAAQEILKKGEV